MCLQEEGDQILDLGLLKSVVEWVFAPEKQQPPREVSSNCVLMNLSPAVTSSSSVDTESCSSEFSEDVDDLLVSQTIDVICEMTRTFSYDSAYSSVLDTPTSKLRSRSESGYVNLTECTFYFSFHSKCFVRCVVMDQLLKWSPSLPTTPGSPPWTHSRRSHSAESPQKAYEERGARRKLFVNDRKRTEGSSISQGQSGGKAINQEKYKTMHCRNYSSTGSLYFVPSPHSTVC